MQIDQNPFFRKPITPWYDSKFVCILLLVIMIPVFFFSLVGISVALTDPAFGDHVWFPVILAGFSAFVAARTLVRMRARSKAS